MRLRAEVAALTAFAIALTAAAWGGVIAARTADLPHHIDLPVIPGWQRTAVDTRAPWQPNYPGADHYLFGRYADAAGDRVDMAVAVFAGQRGERKLFAFGTGVLREADPWVRVADLPPIQGGAAMRIVATPPGGGAPVERIVASWYRVGGIVTGSGTRVKLATAKARLTGASPAAAALHLSVEVAPGRDPQAAIRRFLAALGPVDTAVDAIVQTPR